MAEFDFIKGIKELFTSIQSNSFEGIGDDCAVFNMGEESLLFTTDMLQEDIHFLRSASTPFDLGYKSLAVNLSDVAAMGGRPIASMLSLSLPKELSEEWAEEFMRGYHSLSQEWNVALIGGDTTSSKSCITINVVAIGRAANNHIKRRSTANVGDVILVNGMLGASGYGLRSILQGEISGQHIREHLHPRVQVAEGEWLGSQNGVTSMMDISDGVASDLRHILSASGVGATIELCAIPTAVDIQTALTAGEDYKLLLTASPNEVDWLCSDYLDRFASPLYPIGVITNGNTIRWEEHGKKTEQDFIGFIHNV